MTVLILVVASLCGCVTSLNPGSLTVSGGTAVTYACEDGQQILARYYSLSDGSLHFVKVTMPDGNEYTLPNAMSASGARYTDDREFVWWTKGDTGFVEVRREDGDWETKHQECREVRN